MATEGDIERGLGALVRQLYPGAHLREVWQLGADTGEGATGKADGYGQPLRLTVDVPGEGERTLVFHTATANPYGHDRRSDRAAELLLAYDTFGAVPDHVRALDVGLVAADGSLRSLRDAGEPYLVTSWAPGRPYAEDLRRAASAGTVEPLDLQRCDALVRYLVRLHQKSAAGASRYRRSVRDLVGHGEGVFGIVDGYPDDTPAAPPRRLESIERACADWRWRLRRTEHRLARTHGDFHPFNIVFDEGARFTVLDASRGCLGDPADDVTALAVNYVFFALERRHSWKAGLGVLWHHFWASYLEGTEDSELLTVAAPYFAWRALVVCNPHFYPAFPAAERDALLRLAERALGAVAFDPAWADALFP